MAGCRCAPHLQREGVPVTNARPKEGLLFWNHAAFIPKDLRKAEIAMEIVNTMLSEEYGTALTKASNYGPMSAKALAGFSDQDQKRVRPRRDRRQDGSALYGLWPDDMNSWIEAWASFKSA